MRSITTRALLALGACAVSLPSALAFPNDGPTHDLSSNRVDSMIGFIFEPHHAANVSVENFQRFKDMGGRVVRIPLRWSDVESVQGSWTFSGLDVVIARARALELEVIGIIGNGPVAPSWATGFRNVDALPYISEWMQYVHNVVDRYQEDVHLWEIGNEPFTSHGQMVPFGQYAHFLRASYRMAKAVDPGCTVIHGGVRYQDDTWKVVNYILAPGAGKFTDGLNFHTLYRSSAQPEDRNFADALDAWSDLANQWDVRPDLYLTESAWASSPGDGAPPWGYVSEDIHAAYSVRTLIIGLTNEHLKVVVNAWLINDNHLWGYWDDTGYIREDGTEKAAYFATRFAHKTLSGLRFEDDSSRPGVERYVFRGQAKQVSVLWTTNAATHTISWIGRSPEPRFFDQLGGELFPDIAGGRYVLTLDRRPIYIVEE